MPSADLFLQLLEEKELVSAPVLQAARREMERSQSLDAVSLSLWLVQGQHITASQAERLLAAAASTEQAGKRDIPADPAGQPDIRPRPVRTPEVRSPEVRGPERPQRPKARPPKPQRPTTKSASNKEEDLELGFVDDDPDSKPAAVKSAPLPPAAAASAEAAPRALSPHEPPAKKEVPAAKIGGELDTLQDTMKGPLDSLIDSEGLSDGAFDDPMGGPQLNPTVRKKFRLSSFLKNLFRRNKSKVVRVKATDPRQVKIILISWGVAGALLLGLLTTFWFLSAPASTEILQKADDAATAKDYALAVQSYDDYLKLYPKAPTANDVRWRRCLAVFRLAEQKALAEGDWTPAYAIADKEVKALPKEHTDSDVVRSVSVALAKIGEGLAQQAQAKPDITSVERGQEILNLIDSDFPADTRPPDVMLEEIRRVLKPLRQKVESRRELETTLEAIRAAAEASDVQAAYAAYRDLLKLFPDLSEDARLNDAMKAVSAVQQKAVKVAVQSLNAAHEERPSGLLAAMPLSVQSRKGELAAAQGKRLFVVEQGTAYGLNAVSGKTLWRRFVALDPRLPAVTALPLSSPAGGDVVLCDPVHREVSRVAGATGDLVWRLALPQPIVGKPVQAGKWLLLLTQDRRLELIDLASGEAMRYFQLPQAVNLAPVVDPAHGLIFLIAERSNLFVLDTEKCRQVVHVGHEAGTIKAPPAVVGDFLFLPVNDAAGEAAIRIFSIASGTDSEPLRALQGIRVAGSIGAAPVALGKGAAVVTDQGSLFALERVGAGAGGQFQVIASRPVVVPESSPPYPVSDGKTLWVAGRILTRFAVRAQEQRIVPQATNDSGMKVVQAPWIEGGTMFLVLQKAGMPGLTVATLDLEKNDSVWQTWIAAPLAAEPTVGVPSGKLTVVTSSGGMFRAPLEAFKRLDRMKSSAAPWEPILTISASQLSKAVDSLLPLPGEMFAITSGAGTRQIAIYDPQEQDKQFRFLLAPRAMAVAPGLFVRGLLTPCENGQVFLLDAEARGQMAKPLPPALRGVNVWRWRSPITVDDQLVVLCDGDKRLTVAKKIDTDDGQALSEVSAATSKTGLVSPIAVLGRSVFVADSANQLLSFELPGLTPAKSQVLGSRCVWGPTRAGKLVLLATEKDHLFALGEQQQIVWQTALGNGPLVGAPCLVGGEIYLSSASGVVQRIAVADGKELGKVDAGCPLGTGPLVLGTRLFVGGHEGSLLELKMP